MAHQTILTTLLADQQVCLFRCDAIHRIISYKPEPTRESGLIDIRFFLVQAHAP